MSVLVALLAVLIMIGEQEFYAVASRLNCCRRTDADLHSLRNRINAACHQSPGTGRFHKTDSAGTGIAFSVIEGTQGRNLISAGFCSLEDRQSVFNLIGDSLYFNVYD